MRGARESKLVQAPVRQLVRASWLLLGFLCVGLGFVGVFVPLMPTTIFIILGAACFARSSPRLEGWLLGHSRFGPTLQAWREEGAIPPRAKRMACVGMAIGYTLFWIGARPGIPIALTVGAMMAGSAAWIVTRPAPGKS
ncbi:YbaN family protein [Sphingomonas koreensis]